MNLNQEPGLRSACEDCKVFVACRDAKETSEARIAELEVSKYLHERYSDEMGGNLDEEGKNKKIKQFEFDLWVMKNETYKDDYEGFVAALKDLSTRYSGVDMPLGLDAIADESSELYTLRIRNQYRDVLLDAVETKGCTGPREERSGFLGRKVTSICNAPVSPVEKILAVDPPPTN